MALGIKALAGKLPACRPGDVFITNDPWALAGHLNDVCVMSPIFHRSRVAGFTACVFHHSDIGGRVSSDNHDVHEDGLFIPLVKLYDAGTLNEAVMEMIRWNVRTPEEVVGDIRSQIAANHVCAARCARCWRTTASMASTIWRRRSSLAPSEPCARRLPASGWDLPLRGDRGADGGQGRHRGEGRRRGQRQRHHG